MTAGLHKDNIWDQTQRVGNIQVGEHPQVLGKSHREAVLAQGLDHINYNDLFDLRWPKWIQLLLLQLN
jgi:hypothetical protein